MERLTDNTNYCSSWSDCEMAEGKCVFYGNCYDRKIYNKLREYEDLEEQGKLIKLPCKVGDSLYRPIFCLDDVVRVKEIIVSNIGVRIGDENCEEIRHEIETAYIVGSVAGTNIGQDAYFSDFGKTIFYTKAEAEKALAEMEK